MIYALCIVTDSVPSIAFLRLFFEHVYPYTPILDRVQFCKDFLDDDCSHFLLYTLLANVVPYASLD